MKMMNDVQVKRPARRPVPIRVTGKVKRRSKRIELGLNISLPRFRRFDPSRPLHWAAVIIMLGVIIAPIWSAVVTNAKYQLSPQVLSVVSAPAKKLLPQLNYDNSAKAYIINTDSGNAAGQSTQIGGSGYKASFPTAASQGVTIQDNSTNLRLGFTPAFSELDAKLTDGHIIYPAGSLPLKTLYTVKANGVKEDVVLPSETSDTLSFSYELNLPQTLEARMLPDGGVGIYSADTALLGQNVQTGSVADQQLLDRARTGSTKNHLAFIIPAPTINQSGSGSSQPIAKFSLAKNKLTVTATGLRGAAYPLSIDPTFIVTSVNDFQAGNAEDNSMNIDQTNNQLNRWMSGGTVSSWAANSSLPAATADLGFAVYNGHVYEQGGLNSGKAINSATISSSGRIGTFTPAATLGTSAAMGGLMVYNGYLYAVGGISGTSTVNTVVQYAKINPDGSLGSFANTTASLNTARALFGYGVYNGFIYVFGGCVSANAIGCLSDTNTTEYGKILPNGDIASWAVASNTFTTARFEDGGAVYNGRAYVFGGYQQPSSVTVSDIQYANINSDGSLGVWQTNAVGMPGSDPEGTTVLTNAGYVYVLGGTNNSGGTNVNTVYYAQFNADGTVGSFTSTSAMTAARSVGAGFVYDNQLYVGGGCGSSCAAAGQNSDLISASIDPAYTLRGTIADGSLPTPVWGGQTLVYNGFVYVFGGCTAAPTYLAGALQPCPAANIIGHGADTGHAQGTSGDRLTIQFAHIASDGSIDTGYTISGYTATNGWFTDKATCSEAGLLKPDACPGSRYAFAGVFHGGHYFVISGRGGDQNGTSNGNSLTADANFVWFNTNGTPGAWVTGSNAGTGCGPGNGLNTAREFATAGLMENFWHAIYVVGGRDSSGNVLSSIEQGGLNYYNGGNNCDWANASETLPNGRWQAATVSYAGNIYVIGGRGSGSTVYSDIQMINPANSTESTACSSCGLPSSGIYGAQAFVDKGELYVVGGVTNGTDPPSAYSSAIYQATISASGSIGTFTAAPATLSAGSYQGNIAYDAWHDTFYAIGGANSGGMVSSVQYEPLNLGGSGNLTWSASSSDTGVQRAAMGVAQYKNFVYLVGGYNGSYLNTVQMGTINQDGTITWSLNESNTIPVTMAYNGAFVANGYLYAVGGRQDDTNAADVTNEIYRAPINASTGHLSGAFVPIATLNMPLEGFATAVYNGYVYVIDGRGWPGGTETAEYAYEYAPINSDGSLGAFTTAGTNGGVAALFGVNASVGPGGIYLGEGSFSACSICSGTLTYQVFTAQGAVAQVNANHTLTFNQDGGSDNYGIEQTRVVYDGMAYGLGGGYQQGGTASATNSTNMAPVLSGPDISQQSWADESSLPTSRTWHVAFAYNGRVYVVGGCQDTTSTTEGTASLMRTICSGTYLSTENHASIASIPRVAHYSKLLDADLDVAPTKLITNGSLGDAVNSVVSLSYETSTSTGNSWSSTQTPSLILGTPLSIVADAGGLDRYYWVEFTLDDTLATTFPDTSTALSDFELYFHTNPSRRLRGGASFAGGNCRVSTDPADNAGNCSLDASP